jgi:hypothetical protein
VSSTVDPEELDDPFPDDETPDELDDDPPPSDPLFAPVDSLELQPFRTTKKRPMRKVRFMVFLFPALRKGGGREGRPS